MAIAERQSRMEDRALQTEDRMDTPAFSIVITTVDRPQLLLTRCAALARPSTDFELIVVNDGPDLDLLPPASTCCSACAGCGCRARAVPGWRATKWRGAANGRFLPFSTMTTSTTPTIWRP